MPDVAGVPEPHDRRLLRGRPGLVVTATEVLGDAEDVGPRRRVATGIRWRPVLVSALAVVGCVGLIASVVAVAAERTVLETDRFAGVVERSLDEPAVTGAIAGVLADQVTSAVTESGALARVVPDELQALVPVLERALRGFVFEEAEALLASERGRELIVGVVRLAHGAALRVVDGEEPDAEGLVVVDDGRVALNLVPLVAAILRAAERAGLVEAAGPIPELDLTQPVPEQIERLGASLGTELEPTFGQLTVFERRAEGATNPVGLAQRLLELLRSALALLVMASLLLLVAAFVLSGNRSRTARWALGGLATGGLLAFLAVRRVVEALPGTVQDPTAKEAVSVLSAEALAGVLGALVWLTVLAAVGVGAWWAARSAGARALPSRFPALTRVTGVVVAAIVVLWLGASAAPLVVAAAVVVAGFLLPALATA